MRAKCDFTQMTVRIEEWARRFVAFLPPRKRCSQNLLTLWSVVSILKDRSPATSSLFRIFLVCFSAFCRMDARYVFAWISTCNFFCLTCGCAFFFSVWKHFVWLELSSFLSFIFYYFREFRMHKNNDLTSTHREQKGGLNFQETAKNGRKLYQFKRIPIFCNHFWQFDFKINDELTFFVWWKGIQKDGTSNLPRSFRSSDNCLSIESLHSRSRKTSIFNSAK